MAISGEHCWNFWNEKDADWMWSFQSDHDDFVFAEEEERKLIDHGLNGIFEMGSHHLESNHISKLVGE